MNQWSKDKAENIEQQRRDDNKRPDGNEASRRAVEPDAADDEQRRS